MARKLVIAVIINNTVPMKPKYYLNDTYQCAFFFCIGWEQERFDVFLKRFDGDFKPTEGSGRCIRTNYKGNRAIVIWVDKKRNHPTIAHECLHAANFVLDNAGVHPSFENDEAQAYLMTQLIREANK